MNYNACGQRRRTAAWILRLCASSCAVMGGKLLAFSLLAGERYLGDEGLASLPLAATVEALLYLVPTWIVVIGIGLLGAARRSGWVPRLVGSILLIGIAALSILVTLAPLYVTVVTLGQLVMVALVWAPYPKAGMRQHALT